LGKKYGFVDFMFGMGCLAKTNNDGSCSALEKCNSFEKLKELFIYFLPPFGKDREAIVQKFLSSTTEELYYSLLEIGTISEEKKKMVVSELIRRPDISPENKKNINYLSELCPYFATLDN
jgi:hypothetical protein